jgi:hypothetical protein
MNDMITLPVIWFVVWLGLAFAVGGIVGMLILASKIDDMLRRKGIL